MWRCAGDAVLSPSSSDLGLECVESPFPEAAIALQPHVDLLQGLGVHGVEPAPALGSHVGESAFAQHAQVPRHGGLCDAELGAHDIGEPSRGRLAVGQQFEDPAPHRVAEHVEGVHESKYMDQLI